jgi:hypothetical protein
VESGLNPCDYRKRGNADRFVEILACEPVSNVCYKFSKCVTARKNDVNYGRSNGQVSASRGIQKALQFVGEFFDRFEAQVPCSAFECMECSEHAIERVFVRGTFLKNQHALLDILEQVLALVAKFVEEIAILSNFERHGRLCVFRALRFSSRSRSLA